MHTLIRTTAAHPDFQDLITQLDQDLWSRYQPWQAQYEGFNKVDELARVVVAYIDGQAAGCGCFRPSPDTGTVEIKRMFVKPTQRGQGLAGRILQELESWAQEAGYHAAQLETGIKQPEAIALYRKTGYQPIPNYGPYVGLDTSLCLGKRLVD